MKNRFIFLASLVASMHFFGFFLMNWETTRHFFEALTPANLLVSGFALLYFHPNWDKKFGLACLCVFGGGLCIEIVGVHTGWIFGKYEYGKALGIKILDVPLTIGLNWLVLLYATSALFSEWKTSIFVKAIVPALLMTSMDYLIEPVAIKHDFWHWFGASIPFSNYRDWFIAAYMLGTIFFYLDAPKKNKMVYVILLSQLFFFGMHWIWEF
jgi:putative membrane protein